MDRAAESHGKQKICDALCKLGESRAIEKVTVREITAEAGINRSSFYYHFAGVSEALAWMVSGFLEEYLGLLCDISEGGNNALSESHLLLERERNVCRLIQRRESELDLFFNPYNQPYFREQFWLAFQKHTEAFDLVMVGPDEQVRAVKRGIAYDYCLRVYFATWFELLACWHERGFHETAEDFLEIFDIMSRGMIGFQDPKTQRLIL